MPFIGKQLLCRLFSDTPIGLANASLLRKTVTNNRHFRRLSGRRLSRSYHLVPNNRLTVENAKQFWLKAFIEEKVAEPRCSIDHLLAFVLGSRNISVIEDEKDRILPAEKILLLNKLATERFSQVPIQYILGEWDFLELTLKMKRPVFIPRPETEDLVILARSLLSPGACRSLEIGSGTGAISLALLNGHKQLRCTSIDASLAAANLTRENSELLHLSDRLEIIHATLEENGIVAIPHLLMENRFDLVVSNPPYIPSEEVAHLDPGITLYEDRLALDGGNIDGTRTIEMILKQSPSWLKPGGYTVLEIDSRQVSKIASIVNEMDAFSHFQVRKDSFGVDRFIVVQLKCF